jgi:hypothetical protein
MLLVETFVGPSKIEGVGAFSVQRIRAGTLIWEYRPKFDLSISRKELDTLPLSIRSLMTRYAYPHHDEDGLLIIESDNGRFMNHSDTPNTDFKPQIAAYALVDIEPGAELTCDYREFDPNFRLLPSENAQYLAPHRLNGERTNVRARKRQSIDVRAG